MKIALTIENRQILDNISEDVASLQICEMQQMAKQELRNENEALKMENESLQLENAAVKLENE